MPCVIISTLAEYQTRFWVPVALELEKSGWPVTMVSCDTRSTAMIRAAGLDVLDATISARKAALGARDALEVCRSRGIENPGALLTHERFAFGLRDTGLLLTKLAGAILIGEAAIERARARCDAGEEPVLVQELGGFASVLGLHHAALHQGIESLFIEPSFFKGRMLFVENTISAYRLEGDARARILPDCAAYFEEALATGTIVIPVKDKHHYASAATKLLNRHNIRRLFEKARDKYLLGAEQEFGAIGHHVASHAKMLLASARLRRKFTALDALDRFIYYPLHVPGDVALTLRSPQYLDQIALLDFLCRTAPVGTIVATKEHPAMIGAVPSERLLALAKRYDNFAILPPGTNNYAVLRKAERIVTVNSKSGAEAGLLGRKPIVLGDAFYRDAPFARAVNELGELEAELTSTSDEEVPDQSDIRGYFAALWQRTYPGELYALGDDNIECFADSLLLALKAYRPNANAGVARLTA